MIPDKNCRIGCILNIVFSSLAIIFNLFLLVFNIMNLNSSIPTVKTKEVEWVYKIVIIFTIVYNVLTVLFLIPTIILTTFVLNGKLKSHLIPAIFGIIFGYAVGGIVMLCGKYNFKTEKIDDNSDETSNISLSNN
ncbi:hypothetical protein [Spiroplasma corruscae]|nr:hypothetical protein [Spiroplasma corruscae]